MKEIENIIFLGAGASASDNAPIQSKLLEEFFYNKEEIKSLKGGFMTEFEALNKFFSHFFSINLSRQTLKKEFPTFEELLGLLETALEKKESFKGEEYSTYNLQILRDYLIESIALILEDKLKDTLSSEENYHKKLINTLLRENSLEKTIFISLNYDNLIDKAIENTRGLGIDYGVDIEENNTSSENEVILFKLHGSLNWQYCPTCIKLYKKRDKNPLKKCSQCNTTALVPILIPPTFFKSMSNFFIQNIWNKAEHYLKQAKRIIFCGYSFPPADINVKYLLKRAELNRRVSPEIIVINRPRLSPIGINRSNKSKIVKSIDELAGSAIYEYRSYERFFKDNKKFKFLKYSFRDLCKNGINRLILDVTPVEEEDVGSALFMFRVSIKNKGVERIADAEMEVSRAGFTIKKDSKIAMTETQDARNRSLKVMQKRDTLFTKSETGGAFTLPYDITFDNSQDAIDFVYGIHVQRIVERIDKWNLVSNPSVTLKDYIDDKILNSIIKKNFNRPFTVHDFEVILEENNLPASLLEEIIKRYKEDYIILPEKIKEFVKISEKDVDFTLNPKMLE